MTVLVSLLPGVVLAGVLVVSQWTFASAGVAWVGAAVVGIGSGAWGTDVVRRRWRAWALLWALAGVVLWLGTAYVENQRAAFYAGLVVLVVVLALSHWLVRLPAAAIFVVNTLILLAVGLPIVNAVLAPAGGDGPVPPLAARPYSFDFARQDPTAFGRWWNFSREQSEGLLKQILVTNADGALRLRPNTVATFFDSRIPINSQGFRGAELPPKGDAYRIVALGESTTFGLTMGKDDRPWPERLEQLIRERLHPARPVQVINAGIPGVTLQANLVRLERDILPLAPDMLLSYHGYNGFAFVMRGMPAIHGKPPPPYRPRPLEILGNLEYQLAMRRYRRGLGAHGAPQPAFAASPMETEYARLYRELVRIARAHDIRLVLATYSMAVNAHSPPDVADFYRTMHLELDWQVAANVAHTTIVRELAREDASLVLVDTQPALDGRHEHYFDLVHFTEDGEQLMAEAFYAGIADTLQTALAGRPTGGQR